METESVWRKIIRVMRNHFIAGVLVVVPIGASIAILAWLFVNIDNILQPVIQLIFGRRIVGVGFGITIVVIYIIGVVASNIVGRRIIRYGESLVSRIPLFRQIYRAFKQVVDSLSGYNVKRASFREVVIVEFPREGMKALAFITNEVTDQNGQTLYSIFVPTTPIPTSGYYILVAEDMITRTTLTVDEAMKMIMSSGIVSPTKINTRSVNDNL